MAESQQNIDWTAVRGTAMDCLNSTWDMVLWAERSQEEDYDVDSAALHLAVIGRARDTFRRAMGVLQPGFERATDDSSRYSPVFDALVVATVGEGARPEFRFGPVQSATAHEAAFELLRYGLFWLEDDVFGDMDERWFEDEKEITIGVLHKVPLPELRDILTRWGKRRPLAKLLDVWGVNTIRAWIDREWAAVSRAADGNNQEQRIPVCQSKKVKLFGPGKQPEVNGKRKPILTAARYNTVQALIEAGEASLTKDQLDLQSGHTDARKLLKALANDDPDWKKVIRFPGTPGKGYRID